jgi:hypothetical protein
MAAAGLPVAAMAAAGGTPVSPPAVEPPATTLPPVEQPPVEPPVATLPPVEQPYAAPRQKRRGLLVGVGGVAALGVLGAVAFVVIDQLTGPSGGADSPEAAVIELSAAASAEDAVTALSLLPPGEVGPLVELYQDVEAKATSTGVAAAADPLAGFDLQLDGVQVQVEELGDEVAAVTITGGKVSWTVDPGQMQGPLRIDPSGEVRTGAEGSADLVQVAQEATDGAPLRIMTVERDGDWYVSPSYTLLEAWRTDQGLPAPDFSQELDLQDTGAGSAEEAVKQAAAAAAAYDVDGLLDLLSPDEAAALYHYRDAIMTALNRDGALEELRSEGRLEVESIVAEAGEEAADLVPVTVRSASGGVYDDDGDYTSWSFDRTCLSWNEDGDTDGGCLDEAFADEGVDPGAATGIDSLTVLTQEVDGRWYLNPLASLVSQARGAVAAMDVDAIATTLGVPQFGGVDGDLEEGVTVTGAATGPGDYAVYEMDVPAGSVFSTCVEGEASATLYGSDGRPVGHGATVVTEGGVHRVVVTGAGGEHTDFTLRPVLGDVEQVTLPADIRPAGGDACGWRVLAFEATAGQPLLLGAEGGSDVQVTTPSGETAWATSFIPEETGIHHVTVAADQPVGISQADALTTGQVVVVSEDPSGSVQQYVLVRPGESVRIEVVSLSDSTPAAELTTADHRYVDEDRPFLYADRYSTVLADEPGLYLLDVHNIGYASDAGTYRVSVSAN